MVRRILVDGDIAILDVVCEDRQWAEWSDDALMACADHARLVIDPVIFAEVSVGYTTMAGVDMRSFARSPVARLSPRRPRSSPARPSLTTAARRHRRSPLPDFYIGAHAAVAGMDRAHARSDALPHLLPHG